ncbi:TPA: hypothetical protein HA278_07395 [Candidatus Woesearchaeota archaeon]|nr:hypothetical protein [Candidatus Woesearchaeota archaeon]
MGKNKQQKKQSKKKKRLEAYRQKKHKKRLAAAAERGAENETYKMQREVEKIQNKENQIVKSKAE